MAFYGDINEFRNSCGIDNLEFPKKKTKKQPVLGLIFTPNYQTENSANFKFTAFNQAQLQIVFGYTRLALIHLQQTSVRNFYDLMENYVVRLEIILDALYAVSSPS